MGVADRAGGGDNDCAGRRGITWLHWLPIVPVRAMRTSSEARTQEASWHDDGCGDASSATPQEPRTAIFTNARDGWKIEAAGNRSTLLRTSDGGRTWSVDLELHAFAYGRSLQQRGDRLWLVVSTGAFGPGVRTDIYRRHLRTSAIILPDTGSGGARDTLALTIRLLAAATLLAVLLLRAGRRFKR